MLGAGISMSCGAPSTAQLTDELLEAKTRYYKHTDGSYYPISGTSPIHHPEGTPTICLLVAFLRALKKRVASHYEQRINPQGCVTRVPNYEDLAYLAVQLSETLSGERDNPAVVPFARKLATELKLDDSLLQTVADESVALITDHVASRLSPLIAPEGHCQCILDAACTMSEQFLPVITLNHDLLLEKAFEARGLLLQTGMKLLSDGRCIVRPTFSSRGAALYKVHGSIDWFRWRQERPQQSASYPREWIGRFATEKQEMAALRKWRQIVGRPTILVGRFNKELSYLDEPFLDLLSQAKSAIEIASVLVVSGYSFSDKAMNSILIEWLSRPGKGRRRIVVAHTEPDTLVAGARGAIANKWESLKSNGDLIEIRKFLKDVQWGELQIVLK